MLHGFQDRPAGEVDPHGLYVKEAISYAKIALKEARQRGDPVICLIVGIHSPCVIRSFWPHSLCQAKAIIPINALLDSSRP